MTSIIIALLYVRNDGNIDTTKGTTNPLELRKNEENTMTKLEKLQAAQRDYANILYNVQMVADSGDTDWSEALSEVYAVPCAKIIADLEAQIDFVLPPEKSTNTKVSNEIKN